MAGEMLFWLLEAVASAAAAAELIGGGTEHVSLTYVLQWRVLSAVCTHAPTAISAQKNSGDMQVALWPGRRASGHKKKKHAALLPISKFILWLMHL